MSYLEVPVKVVTVADKTMRYRFVGPSDEEPTPADGFTINPVPISTPGVEGKFWMEYQII